MTHEQELKELQMQIDDQIKEETPPGPLGSEVVFDCKEFGYKIEHIIAKGGNGGWRDVYKRTPERPMRIVKLASMISIQAKTVQIS